MVRMTGWSEVLLWLGFAVIALGMVGGDFLRGRRRQRRAYWLSWLLGGAIMTVAVGHADGGDGLTMVGFSVAMSVMIAFFRTPYLKIGGRIYALTLDDRQPDPPEDGDGPAPRVPRPADSYGNLSAATWWWLMAWLIGSGSAIVAVEGFAVATVWVPAFFAVCLAMAGCADGATGFGVARRQYLPAAVLTAVSVPSFLIPPLLYLVCFGLGRRYSARRRHHAVALAEPGGAP
jgi:hypothetical protein